MGDFYKIPIRKLTINNCTRACENTCHISHNYINNFNTIFFVRKLEGLEWWDQYYLSANVPVTELHLSATTVISHREYNPVFAL